MNDHERMVHRLEYTIWVLNQFSTRHNSIYFNLFFLTIKYKSSADLKLKPRDFQNRNSIKNELVHKCIMYYFNVHNSNRQTGFKHSKYRIQFTIL